MTCPSGTPVNSTTPKGGGAEAGGETDEGLDASAIELKEDAPPLDDFEPIVPAKAVPLSDMVLEDRR